MNVSTNMDFEVQGEKMLRDAQKQAESYWNVMNEKMDQLIDPDWKKIK